MTKLELKKLLKANFKKHKQDYKEFFEDESYTKFDKKIHFLAKKVFNLNFETVQFIGSVVFSAINYAKMVSDGTTATVVREDEVTKTAVYICSNFEFFKNYTYHLDSLHTPMWCSKITLSAETSYVNIDGKVICELHLPKDDWEIFLELLIEWISK